VNGIIWFLKGDTDMNQQTLTVVEQLSCSVYREIMWQLYQCMAYLLCMESAWLAAFPTLSAEKIVRLQHHRTVNFTYVYYRRC
jgi:hypothetical protein